MSILFTRFRKSGGMAGELARKARGSVASGVHPVRRVGGRSSMIRLSIPREGSAAWTGQIVAGAATLAHWMSARGQVASGPASRHSEFAASMWPSA